ncbi:MAG: hypothetical protein ACHQX1_01755 [Candidatus Micrarchaeales archaeon]
MPKDKTSINISQGYAPILIFLTGVIMVVGLPIMMTSMLTLYAQDIWLFYLTLLMMAALMRSLDGSVRGYISKNRNSKK